MNTVKKIRNRSIVVAGNKTLEILSLSLLLQRFEYDVFSAHTAAEALERISANRPALIITDLVLPGMSGMDLFRLLKQDLRTAFIPVIFVIPPSDVASDRLCMESGAKACISKPIQAEELFRTVQEIIEPKPRADIRIDTRLPVSLNNVRVDCPEGVCAVDLSENGIYVPTREPFPQNRRVTVQIDIKDRTISATAAVLHSHSPAEGQRKEPGMGLKFVKISQQDQDFIRKFIHDEVSRDIKSALSRESSNTR
jgi:chemotaxis family two-component system response regulator PixH